MMRHIKLCLITFSFFSGINLNAQENRILLLQSHFDLKTENCNKIKFRCLIAKEIENRQKIIEMKFSIPPDTIYEKDGNRYAEFTMEGSNIHDNLNIRTLLEVQQHDLKQNKKNETSTAQLISPERFLISEQYIETDDETIKEKAFQLRKKDDIKTVENIYKFVKKTIKSNDYNPNDIGAKQALIDKKGDCTEYTDLFVALCRACSIPARHILGYISGPVNVPQHSWAEAYLEGLGWTQFEISPGNDASFESTGRAYIYLTDTRRDKNLNYGYYYSYYWWGDNTPTVKNTINIKEYTKR